MTTKAQRKIAEEIMNTIDAIRDMKISDEIYRVYAHIVPLADMITRGWVTQINTEAHEMMIEALPEIRTIALHGTWQAPGADVTAFVTTDENGNLTADSEVSIAGNLYRATPAAATLPDLVGRPAIERRVAIAGMCAALGFTAQFGGPVSNSMRFRREGWHFGKAATSPGFQITVRHATA